MLGISSGLRRRHRDVGAPAPGTFVVAITLLAIALFVATGSTLFAATLDFLRGVGPPADPSLLVAFLLNVALIMLGWRRSVDLKRQVAARVEAENVAIALVHKDHLTGLANRRFLGEVARGYLHAKAGPAAVLVMDLDHFKKVNDLHGHAAGDFLLIWFGRLLQTIAPASACCARLSGDEFAIFVPGDDSHGTRIEELAREIVQRLSEPVDINGQLAHIGASIGLAAAGPGDLDVDELLRRGDIAMYDAKRRGKNCFAWFTDKMGEDLRRRAELESEMREGITRGEFVPYFQPQVRLTSGALHGFEVLARWNHPSRGLVEPTEFIAIAEASGLIANLSLSVMRQALVQARDWHGDLTIAINISPVQLKDPLLDKKIAKILVETGFPAPRLELEITESSLFDDMQLAVTTIESLKNLGVKLSLDDFGTGYSSLTKLQSLPFDRIKIDRSFVSAMGSNEESAAIVNAIVKLCASLNLPVTAEGIENSVTQDSLLGLGCADGQGWLYGKAQTGASVEANLDVCDAPQLQLTHAADEGADPAAAQLHERRDMLRRGKGRMPR